MNFSDDTERLSHFIHLTNTHGFRLFPVSGEKHPIQKKPLITGWQEAATNEPEQLKRWAESFPGCNWGIITGDKAFVTDSGSGLTGLFVLDLDRKKGKDGIKIIMEKIDSGELPEEMLDTLKVSTPSGGAHCLYTYDPEVTGTLGSHNGADGIDWKANGGLVLAAGSSYGGSYYEPAEPALPIRAMDEELLRYVRGVTPHHSIPDPAACRADLPLEPSKPGELSSSLSKIDPDLPYEGWRNVIWSAETEFGTSNEVRTLCRDWSRKGRKWDEKEFNKVVESYDRTRSNHDSLAYYAKEYPNPNSRSYSVYHDHYVRPTVDDEVQAEKPSDAVLSETLRIYESYGNRANATLKHGLRMLCEGLVYGILSSDAFRNAYPLDTGLGKTTAIKALIKTIHEKNLPYSLVIAAETIEQLAELQKDVIALGVPSNKVGIFHNSPEKEVPSIEKDQLDKTQFLLIAHARVKNRYVGLDPYLTFGGKARDLQIWDEKLTTSQGNAVSRADLVEKLNAWIGRYEVRKDDGESLKDYLEEFYTFAREAKERLLRSPIGEEIELPYLDPVRDWETVVSGDPILVTLIDATRNADTGQKVKIVQPRERTSVVQFFVTVPDSLNKVVILDASAPISKLVHYDKSVTIAPLDVKRDHSRVKVYTHKVRSSRNYLSKREAWEKYKKEFMYILQHEIPKDEEVLAITFKERDGVIDFKREILEAADSLGFGYRERVHVITYGSHKGVNKFSHVRYFITMGVQYRDVPELMASIMGQRRSLEHVTNPEVRAVQLSEQGDLLYQGISRCYLRRTVDGVAGEMYVYLFHWEVEQVGEILRERMPSIQFEAYTPRYLLPDTHGDAQYPEVAERIVEYLDTLPMGEDKVSTRTLRKAIGYEGTDKVWKKALKHVEKIQVEWLLQGRSFKRYV
jgi:hypothetical protein